MDMEKPLIGYEGWTNYETCHVASWHHYADEARSLREELVSDANKSLYEKADALKAFIEEDITLKVDTLLYRNLLKGAIERVNWREIVAVALDGPGVNLDIVPF
jgi:hypothetical protein